MYDSQKATKSSISLMLSHVMVLCNSIVSFLPKPLGRNENFGSDLPGGELIIYFAWGGKFFGWEMRFVNSAWGKTCFFENVTIHFFLNHF